MQFDTVTGCDGSCAVNGAHVWGSLHTHDFVVNAAVSLNNCFADGQANGDGFQLNANAIRVSGCYAFSLSTTSGAAFHVMPSAINCHIEGTANACATGLQIDTGASAVMANLRVISPTTTLTFSGTDSGGHSLHIDTTQASGAGIKGTPAASTELILNVTGGASILPSQINSSVSIGAGSGGQSLDVAGNAFFRTQVSVGTTAAPGAILQVANPANNNDCLRLSRSTNSDIWVMGPGTGGQPNNLNFRDSTAAVNVMSLGSKGVVIGNIAQATTGLWLDVKGALGPNSGTAIAPTHAFNSEVSLGLYRSGASSMALSYGTLDLFTGAVNLSVATLAAATSAINNGLAVVFRASGLSLVYKSGSSIYVLAASTTSGTA